jgi:hypothetical protein
VISLFRVVVIALLSLPAPAGAWGPKGHKIVAMIAANRLSPAAQQQVKALLADDPAGTTLPAIAAWADDVKDGRRRDTTNWHFVNIPVGDRPTAFDPRRDCRPDRRRGDCIINAVERQLRILAERRAPTRERRDALKFVTHLVADLHQPLHCAERNDDRGGNDVDVTLLGERGWNLHRVWDSGLIAESGLSQNKYVEKLSRWLREHDVDRLGAGTPVDWANESHALALTHSYRTPTGRAVVKGSKLDARYVDAGLEVIDTQLARAGVRLAAVVEQALR